MKSLLITSKGVEESAAKELKELISADAEVRDTVLEFIPKSMDDLCKLCYFSQSASRIIMLLKHSSISSIEDVSLDIDISSYLKNTKTFFVECQRVGTHNFKSFDVGKKLIHLIADKYSIGFTPKAPDIVFFAYIYEKDFYFGIDIAGFDLSKRSYKIYSIPNSLKGPVGYAVVREAGLKKDDTLIVTSSKDGIIPIEAAFFISAKSVNFFNKDKFIFPKFISLPKNFLEKLDNEPSKTSISALDSSNHNITLTKKNAKIAGVDKLLSFSRIDLQWLDTKFDKESIGKIIAHLPSLSKNRSEKDIKKIYREFFYQTSFIIKPSGLILALTQRTELIKEAAAEYGLKIIKEKIIHQGESIFYITIFSK